MVTLGTAGGCVDRSSGSDDESAGTASADGEPDSSDDQGTSTDGGDDLPMPEPCAEPGEMCPEGSVCQEGVCWELGEPPPCDAVAPTYQVLPELDGAADVTLADLHGDGFEEIIAAYDDRLRVFAAGQVVDSDRTLAPLPVSSPLAFEVGTDFVFGRLVFGTAAGNVVTWHALDTGYQFDAGLTSTLPFAGAKGLALNQAESSPAQFGLVWGQGGVAFVGRDADTTWAALPNDLGVVEARWLDFGNDPFAADDEGVAILATSVGFGGAVTTTVGRLRSPSEWEPWGSFEGVRGVALLDLDGGRLTLVGDHTFDPKSGGGPHITFASLGVGSADTYHYAYIAGAFDGAHALQLTGSPAEDIALFGSDGVRVVIDNAAGGVDSAPFVQCVLDLDIDDPIVSAASGDVDGDGDDELVFVLEAGAGRRVMLVDVP